MGLSKHSFEQINKIFSTQSGDFESFALDVFSFQYHHVQIYKAYADAVNKTPANVTRVSDIPFLPIQFFKTHQVIADQATPEMTFESSGTTGTISSKHYVKDLSVYEQSFMKGFERFYGDVSQYCILGLLPSYLERQHSSLVYMVDALIKKSTHQNSGFYLYDWEKLAKTIQENEAQQQPTLLIGVAYALLDFSEQFPMNLNYTTIMETGGMKGRREELSKESLHQKLQQAFSLSSIHSEYGMTELLSQGYSKGQGIFNTPPWMKIILRATDNPLEILPIRTNGHPDIGAINIIDLANIYSCAFIATDDVGKLYADGSFEVMGRLENSDIRGCGLMIV